MTIGGTKLAYAARWALALAFSWSSASGCLVTSRKQFPTEEELPTSATARDSAFPTRDIISPRELAPTTDGGMGAQELRLVVDVFDGNVDQELEFRFLISNGAPGSVPPECPTGVPADTRRCGTVPPTGEIARTLEIPVPIADLGNPESPRCVRLLFVVSDDLDGAGPALGSFGSTLVWWVDVSGASTSASLSTCPSGF